VALVPVASSFALSSWSFTMSSSSSSSSFGALLRAHADNTCFSCGGIACGGCLPGSDDYYNASEYVKGRFSEAEEFLASLSWKQQMPRVLRATPYPGMSIVWDLDKDNLHAGNWCEYEIMASGMDDPECFRNRDEMVAFVLRRWW
jgi:hypothetical protein